jgi:hypothetical protein
LVQGEPGWSSWGLLLFFSVLGVAVWFSGGHGKCPGDWNLLYGGGFGALMAAFIDMFISARGATTNTPTPLYSAYTTVLVAAIGTLILILARAGGCFD